MVKVKKIKVIEPKIKEVKPIKSKNESELESEIEQHNDDEFVNFMNSPTQGASTLIRSNGETQEAIDESSLRTNIQSREEANEAVRNLYSSQRQLARRKYSTEMVREVELEDRRIPSPTGLSESRELTRGGIGNNSLSREERKYQELGSQASGSEKKKISQL